MQTIVFNENGKSENLYDLTDPSVSKTFYNCDDIWIRDYLPKIYISDGSKKMIRYRFNAYGEKYKYKNDNNFKEILNYVSDEIDLDNFVLEGGNLEFSARGILITNMDCIKKNNNANYTINVEEEINRMIEKLGINELFTINLNGIIGDDTNGHIDNFIRFIDNETIVYFASRDKSYCNYQLACKLKKQVKDIVDRSKIIKRAIPLYHSKDDEFIKNGKIYPYSKLNFIATTDCFIFPCISNNRKSLQHDLDGLPSKTKIYVINTEAALTEYGGLHCLTANI
jgi:agmatine deiminase|tara:strand:+ start:2726 stop:3571 length:846 start_codon:yes stop_codon:yes gene_type:complete